VQPPASASWNASSVAIIRADPVRGTTVDSLLRAYARGHSNSVRATLGVRDAARAWADYVRAFRSGGRDASIPGERDLLYGTDANGERTRIHPAGIGSFDMDLDGARAEAAAKLGARFSPRTFLNAVIAEGPVPASAVHDAVLRRLGVH